MNTHLSVATGGGEVAQMYHAVKSLTLEDRKDLLGDFKIEISAFTGMAMKTDNIMCLPWNRMRTTHSTCFCYSTYAVGNIHLRWLAEQGIKISSEKKSRGCCQRS